MREQPRPHLLTPVMEERLLKVAYGEGHLVDRWIVGYGVRTNPRVREVFRKHRETARELRSEMSAIHCPAWLSDQLINRASGTRKKPRVWSLEYLLGSGATAALLLMAIVLGSNAYDRHLQQRQLEQAMLEAKASIALISQIMNDTEQTVRDEVILSQTSKPLYQSFQKGHQKLKQKL